MEYILPPTEEPFGPSCAGCELFADSKCMGVSTVRVTIGTARAFEEAASLGAEIDLSIFQDRSVKRSFRILERAIRYCPGTGNDGKGNFRKSNERFSGYYSATIIKTALARATEQPKVKGPIRLASSGHSFTPHREGDSSEPPFARKA